MIRLLGIIVRWPVWLIVACVRWVAFTPRVAFGLHATALVVTLIGLTHVSNPWAVASLMVVIADNIVGLTVQGLAWRHLRERE